MKKNDLYYLIAILKVPKISNIFAKNLIAYCGSAEAVFKERKKALEKIPNIGKKISDSIHAFKDFGEVEKELQFIQSNKIKVLSYTDTINFPGRLNHINNAPVLLYYKGNADLNQSKVLGVVGTRNCTDAGKAICEKLISELKGSNILIVSGLAYGVDYAAHRAALANDLKTIGVLAHGLDMIYPSSHSKLAKEMLSSGGLMTEYPSGTSLEAGNFPNRNRIVAGLVDGLLVIESPKRGGALITANIAFSYDRDVFAVPGRCTDVKSAGCNQLIKHNKAALVESAKDIAVQMGWDLENGDSVKKVVDISHLTEIELKVYNTIKEHKKIDLDTICNLLLIKQSDLSVILLNLELQGLLESLPGKAYKLKA